MIPSHAIDATIVRSTPVDMSFFLQRNTADVYDDMSALYQVRHTSGYSRFIYLLYMVLGIIFYGIGIYTALGILMRSLNGGSVISFATILLLCYVLLNGIIGYGFMFHRKWLLVALSNTLILMGLLAALFFVNEMTFRATQLVTSISIVGSTMLFLFLTRHFLSGRYLALKVVIPFTVTLLVSFLLTNIGMLQ